VSMIDTFVARSGSGSSARRSTRLLLCLAAAAAGAVLLASGCKQPDGQNDGQNDARSASCPTGQSQCGSQCVDLTRDALNCGQCSASCSVGGTCLASSCQCQNGLSACGASCADLGSDGANCGQCGGACSGGTVCSLGVCSASCAAGLTQCDTSCVDPLTSVAHCGTCGNACAVGRACVSGACACDGTQLDCGTGCIDPTTNAAHCGSCGFACGSGQQCVAGGCVCPAGQTCGQASGGAGGGGGTGGSGGAGGTSGSGGSGGGGDGVFGGYITAGTWKGYAWTAKGGSATIMPADFSAVTDFPLCASGQLEASNSNVAMLGWNLNQGKEAGDPALTIEPELEGIKVEITNPGGSELRLQIQGPNGADDEDDRWCAIIPGSGGFIPFDAFNTECWAGGTGTNYAGQPIVAAIVLVPGKATGVTAFDFCVNSLAESDDDGGPVGTGCSLSEGVGEGGGTISGSDTRSVTRQGRNYVVQNNVWNGDAQNQSLSVSGVSFQVTEQSNSASTSSAPASYPSIFIGSNHGHASTSSNLPKQVSALSKVQTGWKWTAGNSGEYNAAYDVWFSTGSGGDSGNPSGGYLMVWFHDPSNAQPLGAPAGTESLADRSWQVWVCNSSTNCSQNSRPVISYVPTGGDISEMSFDLNDFIKNAVADYPNTIQSSWYLTNVFAGFEIWNGTVNVKSDNFCAIVE
jgi:hypothetical protein